MSDQSPAKLSPTAGAFMPGAVQFPPTNENSELEFTRAEFSAQDYEISSARSIYDDNDTDHYAGTNYEENYHPVDNQYDNGRYSGNYYTDYSNGGGYMYGDNVSSNYATKVFGGYLKNNKGDKGKNKNTKNQPQHSNHTAPYYMGGEESAQFYMGGEQPELHYVSEPTPYSVSCKVKQKALADGMTLVCVGCGAFGGKLVNGPKGHNWTSIHDVEYRAYLNAPICPHGKASKKQYGGDRPMGKKHDQPEARTKKQRTHSNKSNNVSKQDHEARSMAAKVSDGDNRTQTEHSNLHDRDTQTQAEHNERDNEIQTSPTKETGKTQSPTAIPAETKNPKSRPNSLMISGWSATIPLQLQNVIDNIAVSHQGGTYDAHERITATIGMFGEFVQEYETVVAENEMLKRARVESTELVLEEKMRELSVGEVKEGDEEKGEKGEKEYLGYAVDK